MALAFKRHRKRALLALIGGLVLAGGGTVGYALQTGKVPSPGGGATPEPEAGGLLGAMARTASPRTVWQLNTTPGGYSVALPAGFHTVTPDAGIEAEFRQRDHQVEATLRTWSQPERVGEKAFAGWQQFSSPESKERVLAVGIQSGQALSRDPVIIGQVFYHRASTASGERFCVARSVLLADKVVGLETCSTAGSAHAELLLSLVSQGSQQHNPSPMYADPAREVALHAAEEGQLAARTGSARAELKRHQDAWAGRRGLTCLSQPLPSDWERCLQQEVDARVQAIREGDAPSPGDAPAPDAEDAVEVVAPEVETEKGTGDAVGGKMDDAYIVKP